MKTKAQIDRLLLRYLFREITPEEKEELFAWRRESEANDQYFRRELDTERMRNGIRMMRDSKEIVLKRIKEKYNFQDPARVPVPIRSRTYLIRRIAAILILVVSTSIYFLWQRSRSNDIEPGKSQAMFATGEGDPSPIDDFHEGFLEGYAGVYTRKNKDGEDVMHATDHPEAPREKYYKLFTPLGGQFCLQLPDSTLIWLNAASTIHFPANFAGDSAEIIINGEAYFEVSPNRKVPLLITAGGLHLEASAARLNIRAYPDEAVKVNFLDGELKLLGDTLGGQKPAPLLIKPKDELTLDHKKLDVQNDVDGYPSIAWKKGRTYFKQVPIQTIMMAISRWYNVDVKYEGQIPDKLFDLDASRNSSFQAVLDKLKAQGVKVEIQKRTVIVR